MLLTGVFEGFFGAEILAKRDSFGFVKDTGILLGREKTQDFLGYCTFHQFKSTIT